MKIVKTYKTNWTNCTTAECKPQKYATPIITQSILHLITKAIARRRIPIATNIEPLVSRSYYYNQKLNLGAYSMFEMEFDF